MYGLQALQKMTFDFGGCQNAFTGETNFADLSGISDRLHKWEIEKDDNRQEAVIF